MESKRFAFGKNWKNYISKKFNQATYDSAEKSLFKFLNKEQLFGKSFLDVGCGSGIHSLVAVKAGAIVTSIDYDQDSVECTQGLAGTEAKGQNWTIKQGSMLDRSMMESLGQFENVYCWGVAHHTGSMWEALDNLIPTVKVGGNLFIAIYNTIPGRKGSAYWHKIKKLYVSMPRFIQIIMEWIYVTIHFLRIAITLRNPFRVFREYKNKRGMSYRHDLNDWLGGYPYEHAKVEELFDFYTSRGFTLVKLKTNNYIGNNQLLFKKTQ